MVILFLHLDVSCINDFWFVKIHWYIRLVHICAHFRIYIRLINQVFFLFFLKPVLYFKRIIKKVFRICGHRGIVISHFEALHLGLNPM